MTNTEFCNLKKLMLAGCISERRDIIDGMMPYQLAQFTERLELPAGQPIASSETWRHMANVLEVYLVAALFKLGEASCADPFNGSYECTPCQTKEATESESVAPIETCMTGHSLQEIR